MINGMIMFTIMIHLYDLFISHEIPTTTLAWLVNHISLIFALFISAPPCNKSPCFNGATCQNDGDSFICNCPEGFLGERCEKEVPCKS